MKHADDILLNRIPEPINITFSLPHQTDTPPPLGYIADQLAQYLLANDYVITHKPQLDIIHNFYEHRFTVFVYKPEK